MDKPTPPVDVRVELYRCPDCRASFEKCADPQSCPVCGKRNAVPVRCRYCGTNWDHYCPNDVGTE